MTPTICKYYLLFFVYVWLKTPYTHFGRHGFCCNALIKKCLMYYPFLSSVVICKFSLCEHIYCLFLCLILSMKYEQCLAVILYNKSHSLPIKMLCDLLVLYSLIHDLRKQSLWFGLLNMFNYKFTIKYICDKLETMPYENSLDI